jgi:hypothetical protein
MTTPLEIPRRLALPLAACALAALVAAAPTAVAKKKKAGRVDVAKAVNAPIPDATTVPGGSPQYGTLTSTIDVGKRFRGQLVRDVNVTAQTLGASGTVPAQQLVAWLTAPNGATTSVFQGLSAGAPNLNVGPLTLDDEATLNLGAGLPDDPTELVKPWAGRATPVGFLGVMDEGPVRGTWTLAIFDVTPGQTSSLVSWRLNVLAGRPFQTK